MHDEQLREHPPNPAFTAASEHVLDTARLWSAQGGDDQNFIRCLEASVSLYVAVLQKQVEARAIRAQVEADYRKVLEEQRASEQRQQNPAKELRENPLRRQQDAEDDDELDAWTRSVVEESKAEPAVAE